MRRNKSVVLQINFQQVDEAHWISNSLLSTEIEVIRIDSVYLSSIKLTYNQSDEFSGLDLVSKADNLKDAVRNILHKPGLAYPLALSEDINASVASCYQRLNINVPKLKSILQSSLRLRATKVGEWVAYYKNQCKIIVLQTENGWLATAESLKSKHEPPLQAVHLHKETALNTLIFDTAGIPYLFGITANRETKLRKITQKLKVDPKPRLPNTQRHAFHDSSLDEITDLDEYNKALNENAAWSTAYRMRWDD